MIDELDPDMLYLMESWDGKLPGRRSRASSLTRLRTSTSDSTTDTPKPHLRHSTDDQHEPFPHAQKYLQLSLFPGSASALKTTTSWSGPDLGFTPYASSRITDEGHTIRLPIDGAHKSPPTSYVYRVTRPKQIATVYYWEVVIEYATYYDFERVFVLGYEVLDLAWPLIAYSSTGEITTGGHLIGDSSAEPYEPGDVIGCGYIPYASVFFTKNGALAGTISIVASLVTPSLYASFSLSGHGQLRMQTNHGQHPFQFDLQKYFAAKFLLSRLLPVEILEEILGHALASCVSVHQGEPLALVLRSEVRHFSAVCRRWRELCLPHLFSPLVISSPSDLKIVSLLTRSIPVASTLHPFSATKQLYTTQRAQQEPHRPWLHSFLASFPLPLPTTLEWICTVQGEEQADVFARVPPITASAIPAMMRMRFLNLTALTLQGITFPSWLRFAQFVLAFKQLTVLQCGSVEWTDAPPLNPPTWLQLSTTLKRITLCTELAPQFLLSSYGSTFASYRYGFLVLCIPQPKNALEFGPDFLQDVLLIRQAFQALLEFSRFESINCYEFSGPSPSWSIASKGFKFTFQGRRTQRYTLSDIDIKLVADASPSESLPSFERVGAILSGLSTSLSCRCHFSLTDMFVSDARDLRRFIVRAMGRPEHLMHFEHNGVAFGYGEAIPDGPWRGRLVEFADVHEGSAFADVWERPGAIGNEVWRLPPLDLFTAVRSKEQMAGEVTGALVP